MTETVRVPRPIKVVSYQSSTILITEYVKFSGLRTFQGVLGQQLAKYTFIQAFYTNQLISNLSIF